MNFEQWFEQNQYDLEFGNDTIDLMKQAYVAGLRTAYNQMYTNEDGDYDLVMWELRHLIEESE